MSDTIYALSTPAGRSGVAVIRVSGPQALESAKSLTDKAIIARQADLHHLKEPVSRETIDHALVIGFEAPASFTGEDIIEYHVHGGRAVVESLLDNLKSQKNHRMAEPGEFTRRAFENGKMDLTEAEAIADLIDAETQIQKSQALGQMAGTLSNLYSGWTEELKNMLAHMEAELEFPDEDLPEDILETMRPRVEKLNFEMSAHLNDNRRGERLRDGLYVAIIGAPNAGKSSLINTLAQRDVAIVSDLAGTTRDIIEVHLDLAGYPFILADTAGLRPEQLSDEGHDKIESEGIRRALERAEAADIKLLMFDGSEDAPDQDTQNLIDEHAILVINKTDQAKPKFDFENALKISAQTGQGIDQLLEALIKKAEVLIGRSEAPSLTRQRHRRALENANEALEQSLSAKLPELMAEDCRLAIREIGRITGKVDVEDLLDVIFNDFCIGK